MTSRNPAIKAIILDMDGVLWRDNQPIGDLPWIFKEIDRKDLRVCLATNNATRSARANQDKLLELGVKLDVLQIVNSADATAQFLSRHFPGGGPVYVVGELGLIETLENQGFYISDRDVLAVIVGMDRKINYEKLGNAAALIRSGAMFIGTNPDRTYPTPEGLMPGAGSILAAVVAASETEPHIMGKPESEMFQVAFERLGVLPHETLTVGDRLETDIAGGQKAGCKTGVVLSGVTTMEAAYSWLPAPDFIEQDLTTLIKKL